MLETSALFIGYAVIALVAFVGIPLGVLWLGVEAIERIILNFRVQKAFWNFISSGAWKKARQEAKQEQKPLVADAKPKGVNEVVNRLFL